MRGEQELPWIPFSPETDVADARSSNKEPATSNQVLATHPLLDARRTFLTALVLATKFIQDKAYSNKVSPEGGWSM